MFFALVSQFALSLLSRSLEQDRAYFSKYPARLESAVLLHLNKEYDLGSVATRTKLKYQTVQNVVVDFSDFLTHAQRTGFPRHANVLLSFEWNN